MFGQTEPLFCYDTKLSDFSAVSNVRQDLTEWQEKHASLVLSTVKQHAMDSVPIYPLQLWGVVYDKIKEYKRKNDLEVEEMRLMNGERVNPLSWEERMRVFGLEGRMIWKP
ncbi:hypothetical protein JHK82_047846 [Glycine max]|nr:hypothetical protein JHK82_047846 [Glycine max]